MESGSITSEQKAYLIKIMKTIINYLSRLIKVSQSSANNVFKNGESSKCLDDVNVPQNDRTIGIINSDLHLYIIY